MITERRLLRAEPDFGLLTKLFQINWLFVVLLCLLAGCGYVALYSGRRRAGALCLAARPALRLRPGDDACRWPWWTSASWPVSPGRSTPSALLLLVLTLRMGHVGKGAERWLELGPVQLQPSEIMKVALAMALAGWFNRASWERVGNPLFLIPPALVVLAPVALILKEPNLGTAFITGVIGFAVISRRRHAAVAGGGCCCCRCRCWPNSPTDTCTTTSAPGSPRSSTRRSDPLGAGYNIIQCEDRARLRRHVGQGLHAGHPGAPEFPAGKTDRLHFLHHRRGMGPGWRAGAAGACCCCSSSAPCSSRCAAATSTGGCWRWASA